MSKGALFLLALVALFAVLMCTVSAYEESSSFQELDSVLSELSSTDFNSVFLESEFASDELGSEEPSSAVALTGVRVKCKSLESADECAANSACKWAKAKTTPEGKELAAHCKRRRRTAPDHKSAVRPAAAAKCKAIESADECAANSKCKWAKAKTTAAGKQIAAHCKRQHRRSVAPKCKAIETADECAANTACKWAKAKTTAAGKQIAAHCKRNHHVRPTPKPAPTLASEYDSFEEQVSAELPSYASLEAFNVESDSVSEEQSSAVSSADVLTGVRVKCRALETADECAANSACKWAKAKTTPEGKELAAHCKRRRRTAPDHKSAVRPATLQGVEGVEEESSAQTLSAEQVADVVQTASLGNAELSVSAVSYFDNTAFTFSVQITPEVDVRGLLLELPVEHAWAFVGQQNPLCTVVQTESKEFVVEAQEPLLIASYDSEAVHSNQGFHIAVESPAGVALTVTCQELLLSAVDASHSQQVENAVLHISTASVEEASSESVSSEEALSEESSAEVSNLAAVLGASFVEIDSDNEAVYALTSAARFGLDQPVLHVNFHKHIKAHRWAFYGLLIAAALVTIVTAAVAVTCAARCAKNRKLAASGADRHHQDVAQAVPEEKQGLLTQGPDQFVSIV